MDKVKLINIQKKYINNKKLKNTFTLKINNLSVKESEFFGLLGPSGCGKSTLLNIIAGLLDVDTGNIFVDDLNISKVPPEKRNIGMVFQEPLLFPHMTLKENIAFGLKIRKFKKDYINAEVNKMLSNFNLIAFKNQYPNELSGGQKQRGCIARALICKPKILLMDEPFSALDPKLREDMRQFIKELHIKYKTTIIFVTHDKEEAFELFDRMAIINDGNIIQIGTPKDIYENPKNKFVSEFLGMKNIFHGNLKDNIFYNKDLNINLNINTNKNIKNCFLIIKPEGCSIIEHHLDITNKSFFILKGIIIKISFIYGFYHIKAKISPNYDIYIIENYNKNDKFCIGDSILIKCDINKINILNN